MIVYHDYAFWNLNAFPLHMYSVSPSESSKAFVRFFPTAEAYQITSGLLNPETSVLLWLDGLLLGSAVKILQGASHCHHLGLPSLFSCLLGSWMLYHFCLTSCAISQLLLGWCKSSCSFALLNFVFWYWNSCLNKCDYVIHHFSAHFLLYVFC